MDMELGSVSRRQVAAERGKAYEGPDLGVGDVVDGYVIPSVSGKPGAF